MMGTIAQAGVIATVPVLGAMAWFAPVRSAATTARLMGLLVDEWKQTRR